MFWEENVARIAHQNAIITMKPERVLNKKGANLWKQIYEDVYGILLAD